LGEKEKGRDIESASKGESEGEREIEIDREGRDREREKERVNRQRAVSLNSDLISIHQLRVRNAMVLHTKITINNKYLKAFVLTSVDMFFELCFP